MSNGLQAWHPRAQEWDRAAAAHLFRRAGFGARLEELERALEEGFEATLERCLRSASNADRDERTARIRPLLSIGDPLLLQAWWAELCAKDGLGLRERVTLLWHDHFATSIAKVDDVRMMYAQNELFRERGMGDFRELLHAVARDPAMLVWLDGNQNRRGAPNENVAREIFELFALGIGQYTETDIQEAARAFTGWGTAGRSFALRSDHHDEEQKTVFGTSGAFDGDDVVDLVLEHPACARHIARRLLEEFVEPTPATEDVEELASELVSNAWDVGHAVETLLRSELFFSERARRSRIAGPVELCVSTLRSLGLSLSPRELARACSELGQPLFRPPSVKGWDGGRSWINAGTWIARHNFLSKLASNHQEEIRRALDVSERGAVFDDIALALLPDAALRESLQATSAPVRSSVPALASSVALVLTSPEYHLY